METTDDIYENLTSGHDLCEELEKLQHTNNVQQKLIRSLESDIEKLCANIIEMKKTQENLKKNISELYKTARAEIERKDRIISELRNELERLSHRQNYRIPLKRDRNTSPSLNNCDDSSGKRMKYENDEMRHVVYHNFDYKRQNRSRSKSIDKYKFIRERSEERKERYITSDKHKQHDYGRRYGLVRCDRNLVDNHKSNSFIKKDFGSKETKREEKKEGQKSKTINNSVRIETKRESETANNKNYGKDNHLKNDSLLKLHKNEDDVTKSIKEKLVEPLPMNKCEKIVKNASVNIVRIQIEKGNIANEKQPREQKRNATSYNVSKKENKTKIEETTMKLFGRLKEDVKQDEENNTCLVSLSLCDITPVPQRTETENITYECNNKTVKLQGTVKEDSLKIKEEKVFSGKCDVSVTEQLIKKEKEDNAKVIEGGNLNNILQEKSCTMSNENEKTQDQNKIENNKTFLESSEGTQLLKENEDNKSAQKLDNSKSVPMPQQEEQESELDDEKNKNLILDKKFEADSNNKEIELPNICNVSEKTSKVTKKPESPVIDNKSKKQKDIIKKENKEKDKTIETGLVREESDRVLRSASKRTSVKEKIRNCVESESPNRQNKSSHNENEIKNKEIGPAVDLNDSFSVNLTHDGEVPVLHIEECASSQIKSIFEPLLSDSNELQDTIALPKDPPEITSSPVKNTTLNTDEIKEELKVSPRDNGNIENIDKMSSSNDVSHNESSLNISISSVNTSTNSAEKVFNTSSARKRRRVILKMID